MPTAKLVCGKLRVSKPVYPSEPGYVAAVNAQMKELATILQSVFDQFEAVSPNVCLEAVQPTFELSQYYVPVKTSDLKNSGYCEITGSKGRVVEVGYAKGGSPHYAMYVHEILEYHHEPPTRSKFLQAAMMEDLSNIYQRLSWSYAEFMQGGAG
jgi:hypothetical protein